jgi:F-type H+-transporting ATPase subunit b
MDATLHALGGILLRAVPTFLLVILLNFYLKKVFFRPLQKILQERYDATGGARKLAAETAERASARAAEYEAAMRAARAEIYQTQERLHQELQERHAAGAAEARARADAAVAQAKAQLAAGVEAAKATLAADVDSLAGRIVESLLRKSAA